MQSTNTILGIIDFRLKGLSYTSCQNRFNVGCSTITRIMKIYSQLNLSFDELIKLPSDKLLSLFYPPENIRRKSNDFMPDFQTIYDRINKKNSKANLYYLWLKYKEENPLGYQYTQFCHYFKKFILENYGSKSVSMVVERVPGEKLFIDWVGDQPEILVNRSTGELKKVHIFVTTIGVSSLIYAEAFLDEKLPNFISGTVNAINYYGAIPKYLVPDNLKAAIIKHTKDELIINSAYKDLERFYDVIVLPPPPRKPKGKATVEKAVQFLETHLIETLKEKVYYSLETINEDIKGIIAATNSEKKTPQSASKMEEFLKYDKPQMRTINCESFKLCDYTYVSKIPNNYHIKYDGHYYSVPYTYLNKTVIVKSTIDKIKICDNNNKLISEHRRSYNEHLKYITKDEHMPESHKYYKEINRNDGNYYRRWASAIGPNMNKMIDRILLSSDHEEQSYNTCNGILHQCTNRDKILVDEIAKKCIERNTCGYSYFKKLLNMTCNKEVKEDVKMPQHNNLRGKEEYK